MDNERYQQQGRDPSWQCCWHARIWQTCSCLWRHTALKLRQVTWIPSSCHLWQTHEMCSRTCSCHYVHASLKRSVSMKNTQGHRGAGLQARKTAAQMAHLSWQQIGSNTYCIYFQQTDTAWNMQSSSANPPCVSTFRPLEAYFSSYLKAALPASSKTLDTAASPAKYSTSWNFGCKEMFSVRDSKATLHPHMTVHDSMICYPHTWANAL